MKGEVCMCIFTHEQAESKLTEWQKILRLQDWDIKIDICRGRNFKTDGQAEVSWTNEKKMAIIHLLDPIDYDNDYFPQDHEISLVHELLHLHMAGFVAEDGTVEDMAQEQVADALSKALVGLKRK